MVNKKKKKMFLGVQVFVACHSVLQLSQLLVSGYMKSSISTIERRYGLSSQKSGLLAAFNEVGANRLVVRSFSSLGREKVCRAARPDGGPPRPRRACLPGGQHAADCLRQLPGESRSPPSRHRLRRSVGLFGVAAHGAAALPERAVPLRRAALPWRRPRRR